MQQQADILIKNASAVLAAVNIQPSPKAKKDAAAAYIEKRDFKNFAKKGNESNRLFFRVLTALTKPCDVFDTQSLIKLHAFLFDGIKPEAGKLRTAELSYDGAGFADSSLIAGSLKRLLSKMNEILATSSPSKEDFALKLTYFFSEMFLLCPFRFGSLVTQAVFFQHFALSRGFDINYDACGGLRLAEAAKVAFITDEPSELYLCLNDAISRVATASTGETVVLEIAQRELKRGGKPKMLVKAGSKKEKKSDKAKAAKKEGEKEKGDKKSETVSKKVKTDSKSKPEKKPIAAMPEPVEIKAESDIPPPVMVNLTELSSDTLKKAAKLKEKIENLQRQLSELLTTADDESKGSAPVSMVSDELEAESKNAEPVRQSKENSEQAPTEKAARKKSKKSEKIELVKIKTDGLTNIPIAPKADEKP